MRQVVLDTETTGLEPEQGHRIIEIGCVEVINRRKTGRTFHRYLCPDREIDRAAAQVHGLTAEFLATQPRFPEVVDELWEFIAGAELIIHNAAFDVAFIDAELARLPSAARRVHDVCKSVLDTLLLARQMHPGQRNSLDALCKRYSIDNSHRELHGALLDAQILLDVYLAMTGGQVVLTWVETPGNSSSSAASGPRTPRPAGSLVVVRAVEAELALHERVLGIIDKTSGGKTLWRQLLPASSPAAVAAQ